MRYSEVEAIRQPEPTTKHTHTHTFAKPKANWEDLRCVGAYNNLNGTTFSHSTCKELKIEHSISISFVCPPFAYKFYTPLLLYCFMKWCLPTLHFSNNFSFCVFMEWRTCIELWKCVKSHTITSHRIRAWAECVTCMKSEFNRKTRNNYASLIFYKTYCEQPFLGPGAFSYPSWKLISNGIRAASTLEIVNRREIDYNLSYHFCEIRFVH